MVADIAGSFAGDEGLIGIAAQLATVGDAQLARVLSSHLSGLLSCLVVADKDSRRRLVDGLPGPNPHVPNFAILTHMLPYRCEPLLIRHACRQPRPEPLRATCV